MSQLTSDASTPDRSASGSDATATTAQTDSAIQLSLHSPEEIDLQRFNALVGDESVLKWVGKPVDDMRRLFVKQVILDDETTLEVETVKCPGFIGIADALEVSDPQGKTVSGHEEIASVLEKTGLLICTFQWNKERYGVPIDTRQKMDLEILREAFFKYEAHHAGALVPARRLNSQGEMIQSFGALNQPDDYHKGLYGKDGFVAVAHRLVFPEFVTQQQARGYIDTIVCWMMLLNPFAKFPKDYNGGDPTRVADRPTLKELLQKGVLAALGDQQAFSFLQDPANQTYCAEYMYINLNTPLYPFNKQGLTLLMDGDEQKATQILELQAKYNNREKTILNEKTWNPEMKAGNIVMPIVPADLPPLDVLVRQQGYNIGAHDLPFPPFRISQIIRRGFHVMLRRYQQRPDQTPGFLTFLPKMLLRPLCGVYRRWMPQPYSEQDKKLADAQVRVLGYIESILLQHLGLDKAPSDDPKLLAVSQFSQLVKQELAKSYDSYEAFDRMVDGIMTQVDARLVGAGDRARFVPPNIYLDLAQNDGDENLPQGWGFRLETVGALIARSVIGPQEGRIPLVPRVLKLEQPRLQGDDVSIVQGALLRAGIDIKPDGIFGPATDKAVKQFQERKGVEPNGIVDATLRTQLGLM